MKTLAFIHSESTRTAVGDFAPVVSVFSHYELGNSVSPFLLLDHIGPSYLQPTRLKKGVSEHPHRGFETVTIAYRGAVAHHDSAGNSGVIYPGDVQWMTAGSGILHKEYHEESYSKKGGLFQMVQLWVNLPAKYKMSTPKYQALPNDGIAKYHLPEGNGYIEVIAGEYQGIKGSASTFTPIEVYNLKPNAGAKVSLASPANYNTALIIIEGSVTINGAEQATTNQMVHFANEGSDIEIEAKENSIVLFLSGEPINEPIAQYGPFLMNKPEELQQAIEDYNTGKFGYLE